MKRANRKFLRPDITAGRLPPGRAHRRFAAILGAAGLLATPIQTALAQPSVGAGARAIAGGDYLGAVRILTPLVARGDPAADRMLGGLYLSGLGVAKDCEKGKHLVQAAAEANDVRAEYLLGKINGIGTCGKADSIAAFAWYEKAAAGGDPDAAFSVGLMLSENQGIKPDLGRAYYWSVISAREFQTLSSEQGLLRDHPSIKNMSAAEHNIAALESMMSPADRRRATALLTAGSGSSFNLICSGVASTTWTSSVQKDEKFTETLRIDPFTGLYCRADCKVVVPLDAIDRRNVVVIDRPVGPPAFGRDYERIDLQTGAYSKRMKSSFFETDTKGHCAQETFAGFPQRLGAFPD